MGYQRACPKDENLVKVVRCKDCKHSINDKVVGEYWCALRTRESDGEFIFYADGNWFCADGEEKGNAD